MTATYSIYRTSDNLTKMGTAPFAIAYICGGVEDWEYERRTKNFYNTIEEAHKAGKRYLRKMKNNGFEVCKGTVYC